jgi:hypothetical protein
VPTISKKFKTTIHRDGAMCFIPLTFDPKPVFGKVRAPVKVSLNGYIYRSTIAAMGGPACVPLRTSNREAAGLKGTETLSVTLTLDEEPRVVKAPADLVKALKAAPPAWERWQGLSYSHHREYVEAITEAKKSGSARRRRASPPRTTASLWSTPCAAPRAWRPRFLPSLPWLAEPFHRRVPHLLRA